MIPPWRQDRPRKRDRVLQGILEEAALKLGLQHMARSLLQSCGLRSSWLGGSRKKELAVRAGSRGAGLSQGTGPGRQGSQAGMCARERSVSRCEDCVAWVCQWDTDRKRKW